MADWRTSGMTLEEYSNYVYFAEPQAAAEPIYAALVERRNLAIGSSGGYVSSGAAYTSFGYYDHGRHFASKHIFRKSYAEDILSKLCDVVAMPYTEEAGWVLPWTVSGGNISIGYNRMNDILSSAGLPEFADNSKTISFCIPRFSPRDTVSVFLGLASAVSFLQYRLDGYFSQRWASCTFTREYQSGDNDYINPPNYSTGDVYGEGIKLGYGERYSAWGRSNGGWAVSCIRPISMTCSNGGIIAATVSADFYGSADIEISSGGSRVRSGTFPLDSASLSYTVSAGGEMSVPITGYYTAGKSFNDLIVRGSGNEIKVLADYANDYYWKAHPGFIGSYIDSIGRTMGLSAYAIHRIGESSIFFGGTQTVQ